VGEGKCPGMGAGEGKLLPRFVAYLGHCAPQADCSSAKTIYLRKFNNFPKTQRK